MCDCLSDQFDEVKSYSTLLPVSSVGHVGSAKRTTYWRILTDSSAAEVLKGMFNVCPPVPRYNGTWDVNIVLKLLEN